ncbi:hypothetical protein ABLE91_01840 [Aquabacter sp. CN5-332]|uniref:hypothetical protein n=1 Tax=Aquabacter sp. CN5-332 TaxID=3156608 RepID=UPI0032B34DA4
MLAENLKGFLSELCLISAGIFISYIEADKGENINDIVDSSAELTLKPGLLRYGRHASVDTVWGFPPEVSLDLELHHDSLAAFFRVTFEAQAVGVHIDGILFSEALGGPEENLRRFARALSEARLTRQ